MPDSVGKLTDAELAVAQDWLKQKWTGSKICPVSGHNDWQVQPVVVRPSSNMPNVLSGASTFLELVPVTCGGCGYSMFFSARLVGLTKEGAD